MYNHVYTLIRNTPGTGLNPQDDGGEPTPAGFTPTKLSPALQAIRDTLVGHNPDAWALSQRLRQLFALAHTTSLVADFGKTDPRITYAWNILDNDAEFRFAEFTTATPIGHVYPLEWTGSPAREAGTGRCRTSCTITLVNG